MADLKKTAEAMIEAAEDTMSLVDGRLSREMEIDVEDGNNIL